MLLFTWTAPLKAGLRTKERTRVHHTCFLNGVSWIQQSGEQHFSGKTSLKWVLPNYSSLLQGTGFRISEMFLSWPETFLWKWTPSLQTLLVQPHYHALAISAPHWGGFAVSRMIWESSSNVGQGYMEGRKSRAHYVFPVIEVDFCRIRQFFPALLIRTGQDFCRRNFNTPISTNTIQLLAKIRSFHWELSFSENPKLNTVIVDQKVSLN